MLIMYTTTVTVVSRHSRLSSRYLINFRSYLMLNDSFAEAQRRASVARTQPNMQEMYPPR
jgi:hypothetical protein